MGIMRVYTGSDGDTELIVAASNKAEASTLMGVQLDRVTSIDFDAKGFRHGYRLAGKDVGTVFSRPIGGTEPWKKLGG